MPTIEVLQTVGGVGFTTGLSTVRYRVAAAGVVPSTLPWTQVGVYATSAGYAVALTLDTTFVGLIEWSNGQTPERISLPTSIDLSGTGATGPAGPPGTTSTVAPNTTVPAVYATDEQIYNFGQGDFGVIVPKSNLLASGSDGVFLSSDLWTLTSASINFTGQGLQPGMVIQFTACASSPKVFNPTQFLAVNSVSGSAVTLRRCGFTLGTGQAPSPGGGLTGVSFSCLSLYPQIEQAAYDLNERYAIDPVLANRNPSDVYDQRIFRELTALWVMYRQYMQLNRSPKGDFADKVEQYRNEYQTALDKASVRWGPTGTRQPSTNRFGTRLSR